jgi:hypothetical protein
MAAMAPLQKMFHTILAATSAVTTIVGEKIRPDANKQDDKPPAIYIEVTDDEPVDDLGAASDEGTGQATVQVVCVGHTRKQAIDVANVVRPALADYRGTVNSVALQAVQFSGVNRNYEPPLDGSDEQPWFTEALTFYVFYGPGGPT